MLAYYALLSQEALYSNNGIPYKLDYSWIGDAERQIISDFSIVEGFKKVCDDGAVSMYKL